MKPEKIYRVHFGVHCSMTYLDYVCTDFVRDDYFITFHRNEEVVGLSKVTETIAIELIQQQPMQQLTASNRSAN